MVDGERSGARDGAEDGRARGGEGRVQVWRTRSSAVPQNTVNPLR